MKRSRVVSRRMRWIREAGLTLALAAVAQGGLGALAPKALAKDIMDEVGPTPTLKVVPGAGTGFRAAVLRFPVVGPSVGEARIARLREEIERGLGYSTVVLPLDHIAYLAPEDSPPLGSSIDCESWKQSGADAVLVGEVQRDGVRLRANLEIIDVGRCQPIKTGSVVGQRDDLATLGRLVADETVLALTGLRGVSATEIAFISDRTGHRELYVMSADGRNQRLATRSNTLKMFPEWTPDGKAVLYTSYDRGQPDFSLTSRSPDIKPGPILRDLLGALPKYRGRFDPTGEMLALVSSIDGAAEIFRVNRSGGEPRRLTRHPAIDISPSWSPDGSRLVFCSDRSGSPQLYVMDRDGEDLRRLTYTGAYNASPAWSPDGRWIAYETRVRGQFDIWLIDPSGQINFPIVQHDRSDEAPSWSPDGRKFIFSSARRGRFDLYVMDWNGENLMRLTRRAGKNVQPDWGPQIR